MDEEFDYQEPVPYTPAPFSWLAVAVEFFVMLASFCEAVAEFYQSVAVNFGHAHNKKVDDDARLEDGEKFAQDILSGLEKL